MALEKMILMFILKYRAAKNGLIFPRGVLKKRERRYTVYTIQSYSSLDDLTTGTIVASMERVTLLF